MKKLVLSVVLLGLVVVAWKIGRDAPVKSDQPPTEVLVGPTSTRNALAHRVAPKLLAGLRPPEMYRTVRPEDPPTASPLPPPPQWNGPWPKKLSEVPKSKALEEKLAGLFPQQVEFIDFQLDILPRLDDCFAGRIKSTGNVELWFNFDVDGNGQATGKEVQLLSSTLDEADDRIFEDCANKAFQTSHAKILDYAPDPREEPTYHLFSTVHLPIKNNWIYSSLYPKAP